IFISGILSESAPGRAAHLPVRARLDGCACLERLGAHRWHHSKNSRMKNKHYNYSYIIPTIGIIGFNQPGWTMDRLLAMQVFERVAREGGFAAAARALDISPPVVTRLVAELETQLGTRLFQRTTRRVALTEAGEAYLVRVRQILQDIAEADAIANAHTHELAGRLRVHTQPVLASYVIAPLLSGFRQRHPGIVIDIDVETHRDPPIEDYDITLMGVDVSFDADIVARKVVESEVILVASPAYVARNGTPT